MTADRPPGPDTPLEGSAAGKGALEQHLKDLPDWHPSSTADQPASDPDRRRLTDAEHAEHVAVIRERLEKAHGEGLATNKQHTIDGKGVVWSDERDALHDSIIADLYARAADVPCEHKAIMAGGLPGAGKSTILGGYAGIDTSKYMMINPDNIKEELARRDMIPPVPDLSPMEASDLVHEESSHIAKRLARHAQADGKNLIWDVTMSSKDSTEGRIRSLREAGYTRIEGIFVDIPVEISVTRADVRHREGHDDYLAGKGLGGRFVPEELIKAHADPDLSSINRKTFEAVKHHFDSWARYDNSGSKPVLIEEEDHGRH